MRFFNRISLSTPESVELEFTLAGIGNRALALVIDYNILAIVLLIFWIAWLLFFFGLMGYLEQLEGDYSQVPYWLLGIALLISFVIYNGYFVYFEVMHQGQSPGKRITKIRVIRDDGRPVGISQSVIRSLLRAVDDFLFIGTFFILFGKQEKRIGDWAAGTLVIQEQSGDPSRDRRSLSILQDKSVDSLEADNLGISREAKTLAEHLPEIADLSQLLPDDFAVIREYLRRRRQMAPHARTEKSMQLAHQLQTLIRLEVIPPGTSSDRFLEAVYLAYQQQQE
ncbi:putative membrane protein [Leptolyngbyaceae cyanobacterium JSC-12]|nr:putative membrane protein [Leptolyngbyaceae cyanobacterium JSC-12]